MSLNVTSRGNLVYEPDGQVLADFFWDRSKVSIIQGPIGSGTSSACCHKIFCLANEQEPDIDGVRRSHWLVTRNSHPQLKKTTIPTWLLWFPEAEYGDFKHSPPMQHLIERPHTSGDGTRISLLVTFMSVEDEDQAIADLASLELTGAFMNEIQFTPKAVVDEVLSRCSRYPSKKSGPGATWFGVIGDLNAPKEGHWIPWMRGDVAMPAEWDEEVRMEYVKPDDWRFFLQPPGLLEKVVDGKITYFPNPAAENQKWLTETYIEKIGGKKREWINERIMNRVGLYRAGQAVYPTFVEGEHVSDRNLPAQKGIPIIVGLDFGREPAAAICQNIGDRWFALDEVIGSRESAAIFAPRLKRRLAQQFPGFDFEFYGDPRGADQGQNDETTAYDIFQRLGMRVMPATTDNNPQMRRSTMETVLGRRGGLMVNPKCTTLKTGMAGGYHYPKIKGTAIYRDKPLKDGYSHIVEGLENAILGGGEGRAIVQGPANERRQPSPVRRHRVKMFRNASR